MKFLTALALVLAIGAQTVAHAITVHDPANYAQNVLTARRVLTQIENQIRQLQNEAQMLINQARNLQRLDFNTLSRLNSLFANTKLLLDNANGLAFTLANLEEQLRRTYPAQYDPASSEEQMREDAWERWGHSHQAFHTTMRLQAAAIEALTEDQTIVSDLIEHSQAAQGALQAVQATNQLLALQSRQLIQAQQLAIAQDRAAALEHARALAAEARSRELRRRFMTTKTAYTPQSTSP